MDLLLGDPNNRNRMTPPKVDGCLARRAGLEVELLHATVVVDPISRLLTIGIDMCKPPNAPTRSVLEICAVAVK